jgi:hypothetical protein
VQHLLEDPHEDQKEVNILTSDEIETDYIRVYPSEDLLEFYRWLGHGDEAEAIDHT